LTKDAVTITFLADSFHDFWEMFFRISTKGYIDQRWYTFHDKYNPENYM